MGKTGRLLIGLSLTLNVVLGALLSISWPPREGELANYGEWSELQSAKARATEAENIDGLKIIKIGSSYAVGIETERGRAWLLSNAKSILKIKIINPSDVSSIIRVTRSQINTISRITQPSGDVLSFLNNSVSD